MQQITKHGERAQTQSRGAPKIALENRVAYSPAEFAALCGRSPTWGYRQLYSARIKAITDCGRLLIPRSEVESFLSRKAEYNPVTVGGQK